MNEPEAWFQIRALHERMKAHTIGGVEAEVELLKVAVARLATIAGELVRRAVRNGDAELDGLDRALELAAEGRDYVAADVPELLP